MGNGIWTWGHIPASGEGWHLLGAESWGLLSAAPQVPPKTQGLCVGWNPAPLVEPVGVSSLDHAVIHTWGPGPGLGAGRPVETRPPALQEFTVCGDTGGHLGLQSVPGQGESV